MVNHEDTLNKLPLIPRPESSANELLPRIQQASSTHFSEVTELSFFHSLSFLYSLIKVKSKIPKLILDTFSCKNSLKIQAPTSLKKS